MADQFGTPSAEEFASKKLIGSFPCLLTGQPYIPAVFIRMVETEYPESDYPEWHDRVKQHLCVIPPRVTP